MANLWSLFEEQAQRSPNSVACWADDEEFSYLELEERSLAIADVLYRRGVRAGDVVAVAIPRSFDLLAGLLAPLRLGAAYLPLAFDYPKGRLQTMVDDGQPRLLLRAQAAEGLVANLDEVVVDDIVVGDGVRVDLLPTPNEPLLAAYLLFTSGSTGRPKGVINTHEAIINRLLWMGRHYSLAPADRIAQKTPAGFDVSVWELFLPLLFGARVVFARPGGHKDTRYLSQLFSQERISIAHFVPSMLSVFVREPSLGDLPHLRQIITSGEALSSDLRAHTRHLLTAEIDNLYGPTEAAIDVTSWRCDDEYVGTWEPIGHAIDGVVLRVLSERLEEVASGEIGELYIGGIALAQSYASRADLTAERFIADPFGAVGERLYRSGDLVSRDLDGCIHFLGRNDSQVKIRGQRIELGEIQSVARRHRDVEDAVVNFVPHGGPGDGRLDLHFVPGLGADVAVVGQELSSILESLLPDYMVPTRLAPISEIPVSVNGKADHSQLPDINVRREAIEQQVSGASEIGEQLCRIIEELLDIDEVWTTDDFFALGGSSLDGLRLVHRIQDQLGFEVDLEDVFEAGSVEVLEGRLRAYRPGDVIDRHDWADRSRPLSAAQNRLWFMYKLDPHSPSYHIAFTLNFEEAVDIDALESAFRDVLRRHDVLGSTYDDVTGMPLQTRRLDLVDSFRLRRVELADEDMEEHTAASTTRRFELSDELPIRVEFLRLSSGRLLLVATIHHIAADGWSFWPLHRDLTLAYLARCEGRAPEYSSEPISYADYAVWYNEQLADESADSAMARQTAFWLGRLDGMDPELVLPTDRPRPNTPSFTGGFVPFEIDAAGHAAILELASKSRATTQMVLQSAFAVLLRRLTVADDVPIGVVSAARDVAELDDVVGFFVNNLVLRLDLAGGPSFAELLESVREANVEAFANGLVPFDRVVEAINPPRVAGRHPLVQVVLSEQNAPIDFELAGQRVSVETVITPASKFDLALKYAERFAEGRTPAGIEGGFEFSEELFDRETVERFVRWFVRVLEDGVARSSAPIDELEMLTVAEVADVRMVGEATADTAAGGDELATVLDLFSLRASIDPSAPAVRCGSTVWSYSELDRMADDLAARLERQLPGQTRVVGLVFERSPLVAVAMLAAWRVGASFVPVDIGAPLERKRFIADDADLDVFVTTEGAVADLADLGIPIITAGGRQSTTEPRPVLHDDMSPDDLAYSIYTSGTTGQPKSVQITHRSVAIRLREVVDLFGLIPSDRCLQVISPAFEPIVREIFAPLIAGSSVVFAESTEDTFGPQTIGKAIDEQRPTVLLCIVPSVMEASMEFVEGHAWADLRAIGTGGETLTPQLATALRDRADCVVINQYGPTETTMMTTVKVVDSPVPSQPIAIGRPLASASVYVLDDRLAPALLGVVGEICISGAGLGWGYRGDPALTAERFVANPFGPDGDRLYRTGDLGRWNNSGELEFFGRADRQVKIRGFRVELGEVESVLTRHPGVAQAVVVAGAADGNHLVAYVVPTDSSADLEGLRDELGEFLPAYMVPHAVVTIDEVPLRGNGKVDERRLPSVTQNSSPGRAPRGVEESILCDLVAQCLGLDAANIDTDFFVHGGHSLLAAAYVAEVERVLGTPVPVHLLFEAPTVATLMARLREPVPTTGLEHVLRMRAGATEASVFCMHPGGGVSWSYAGLIPHVPPHLGLVGLQARLLSGSGPSPTSVAEMAGDYMHTIRCEQPVGPYHLLGWSFGGLVAHEIAVQLQEQGEEVAMLVLLDSYPEMPAFLRAEPEDLAASMAKFSDEATASVSEDASGLDGEDTPAAGEVVPGLSVEAVLEAIDLNRRLAEEFEPRIYRGRLLLFEALRGRPSDAQLELAWRRHVDGETTTVGVDAHHMGMTEPRALSVIGDSLNRFLRSQESH